MRNAVTDGTGTHTMTYNADSTLASVTIPYIVDHRMTYTYDTLGRRIGMSLMQNSTPLAAHQYTYDSLSRLATVGNGTLTAAYTRDPGRNRLASTSIAGSAGEIMNVARQYDQYDRLTSIGSTAGTTTRSYNYTYNDRDQRINCTLADGTCWEYVYDDKGQVTGGIRKDAQGKVVPGQSFGYAYDDIGNRLTETRGIAENLITYTANNLNQYTRREFKGVIPVLGEADADATVKAMRNDTDAIYPKRAITAERDGKYFKAMFYTDNTGSEKVVPYAVYAIKDDPNTPGKQLVHKETGSYTVPKAVEPFTYDADGNQLIDNKWSYVWNGENRLISATAATTKLEFAYDYQSRRVSKKVYTGTAGNWTLSKTEKYVYDGFYQIASFDGSNVLRKSYLRNGDELLAMNDVPNAATLLYMFDGNKNVMALVDASGMLKVDYAYDPFGRLITQTGNDATVNPFRFSSEFHDDETGLVYYNYRYYSPGFGRWLSRDPIEETGGTNLYAMVKNRPVDQIDNLGLFSMDDINNATTSQATRALINTANFFDNLNYDFYGTTTVYSKSIIAAMLIAAGRDSVNFTLAVWYVWGNGKARRIPLEWFDTDGGLIRDYTDHIRKKYSRDIWWYVEGTQLKVGEEKLFESQTISLFDHLSGHSMISLYKNKMDFQSYIKKSCENNKTKISLEVNADIKAWDVTDFNKGQAFGIGPLLIPDEIAQSRAVGQPFFISARKKKYPIYTAEKFE